MMFMQSWESMKELPFKLIGESLKFSIKFCSFLSFLGTDISNKKETTNVSVICKFTSSMWWKIVFYVR